MATKIAPAPMKTGNSSTGLKVGIGVVSVLVFIVFGTAQGWWGGAPDPSEEDTEQERVRVTWHVWWGQIVDTGEVYGDTGEPITRLECDERDLAIATFVDGEATVHDQYESDAEVTERCTWRWHQVVPRGSQLRLLVEEGSPGGTPIGERWKMCQVDVQGRMALPNGWAVAPQGGDCEVWGVAL